MVNNYRIEPLSRDLAFRNLQQITTLANLIPIVKYTEDDLLTENKAGRIMVGKWFHSLATFYDDEMIGFIMAYERLSEQTHLYPTNTIYISELAVAPSHQGNSVAKALLRTFFETNNRLGFLELEGPLNYSVQTNAADWNIHVVELYKSFGFRYRATKDYPDRTDVILGANLDEIIFHR